MPVISGSAARLLSAAPGPARRLQPPSVSWQERMLSMYFCRIPLLGSG
jgi:hypothetical protein